MGEGVEINGGKRKTLEEEKEEDEEEEEKEKYVLRPRKRRGRRFGRYLKKNRLMPQFFYN